MKDYYCELCGAVHFKRRSRFCSDECRAINRASKTHGNKGKKQSPETIAKRLANTDQKLKQEKHRATMLERYGVENPSQLLEVKEIISAAAKNRPKTPRSPEHSAKIAEARKRNGTNKHSEATKNHQRVAMLKFYSNPELDRSFLIHENINSWHKSGYIGDIFFRSSYEEKFLLFCQKYNILVESAANSRFAVDYIANDGRLHKYYPDFYLPSYNTVIEIKPISLLDYYPNSVKIQEGLKHHENYVILTELDDFFDEKSWDEFYSDIINNWS